VDTDSNLNDFISPAAVPTPRNTGSPLNPCGTTQFSLTITNAGGGTIASSDGKISCSLGPCTATYDQNTVVILSKSPATGASFKAWTADCVGSGAACTLTMSANRTAGAVFSEPLTVAVAGSGTVTSADGQIS